MDTDYEIAMKVAQELDRLAAIKEPDINKLGKQMMLIGGIMMVSAVAVVAIPPAIEAIKIKIHNHKTLKK